MGIQLIFIWIKEVTEKVYFIGGQHFQKTNLYMYCAFRQSEDSPYLTALLLQHLLKFQPLIGGADVAGIYVLGAGIFLCGGRNHNGDMENCAYIDQGNMIG